MGLAGAAGLAVGAAATVSPKVAVALTIACALAVAIVRRPTLILPMLIVSVSIEIVQIGGVAVTRLVAPVALLVVLLAAIRGSARILGASPLVWAGAYALWAMASSLWTINLGGTEFQLASLAIAIVFMCAFAGLLASRRHLEHVQLAFALTALAVGIFAIAGFFLSLPFELEAGRTSGGTGDPNFFAVYQIIALPLVLVLASVTSRPLLRMTLYATVVVIVTSVFTSVSRGGLLTLLVVVLLILTLPARTVFRSRRQKAVLLAVVSIGAVAAFAAAGPKVATRIDLVFRQDKTGSGRLNVWRGAWLSIHERPFLGLGYGTFVGDSGDLLRRTPGVDLVNFTVRPPGEAVHSVYIGSAAELGIPGLVFFLCLLISTARVLRRTASRARAVGDWFVARTANALFLSLIGWAVASIFLSSETSRSLWIIVGMALALPKLLVADSVDERGELDGPGREGPLPWAVPSCPA